MTIITLNKNPDGSIKDVSVEVIEAADGTVDLLKMYTLTQYI